MNPYTPPKQEPDAGKDSEDLSFIGNVRPRDVGKAPTRKNNRWITVAVYFGVILGVGLAASLLASVFMPDAEFNAPLPTTGVRAHLAIGAVLAMLVCPVFAGFRHWDVLNYLIASTFALGLLLGNVGSGIPLSLISVLILYGTQRLVLILIYFKSSS